MNLLTLLTEKINKIAHSEKTPGASTAQRPIFILFYLPLPLSATPPLSPNILFHYTVPKLMIFSAHYLFRTYPNITFQRNQ